METQIHNFKLASRESWLLAGCWLLLCPEMVLQVFVLEQGPFLHNHVALILINLHAKVLTVTNGYLLNLIIIMKLFELIMHIYTF